MDLANEMSGAFRHASLVQHPHIAPKAIIKMGVGLKMKGQGRRGRST